MRYKVTFNLYKVILRNKKLLKYFNDQINYVCHEKLTAYFM